MPHAGSVDLPVVIVPATEELNEDLTTPMSNISALMPIFRRIRLLNEDSQRVAASGMTALALRLIYCQAVQNNAPLELFTDLALLALPAAALPVEISYRISGDDSRDKVQLDQLETLVVVDADATNESNVEDLYLAADRHVLTEEADTGPASSAKVHHSLHTSLLPILRPEQPTHFPLTNTIGRLTSTTESVSAHQAQTAFRVLLAIRTALDGAAAARDATGTRGVCFQRNLGLTLSDWEFAVGTMISLRQYHDLQHNVLERTDVLTSQQAQWAARREERAMREAALAGTMLPSERALTRAYENAFHDKPYFNETSSSSIASSSALSAAAPANQRSTHQGSYGFFASTSPERRTDSPAPLSRSSTFHSTSAGGASNSRQSSASVLGAIPHAAWHHLRRSGRPVHRSSTLSTESAAWSTGYPRTSRSPSPLASLSDEEREELV
ncbi:hypothetical protein JCM11251_000612 [Rhodosporidiobolus azoricus]